MRYLFFHLSMFFFVACSEAPEVRTIQGTLALETAKAELDAEKAKSADLAKKLADEQAKVRDCASRAQAANSELYDLRIVAETYVATQRQRGDTLIVCELLEGEGEGRAPVGEAVLLVTGDGDAIINGEQAVEFGGKSFVTDIQKDCTGYHVVYAADGTPSITWN